MSDLFRAQVSPEIAVVLNPHTGEIQLEVTAPVSVQYGETFVLTIPDHALQSAITAAQAVGRVRGVRKFGKPIGRTGP